MDKPRNRALLICSRATKLISGLFFFGLVALNILLEVTSLDQGVNLILQFGALLRDVHNVFVIRIVFVLISVWLVLEWVRIMHEGLVGDDVQDLLLIGC